MPHSNAPRPLHPNATRNSLGARAAWSARRSPARSAHTRSRACHAASSPWAARYVGPFAPHAGARSIWRSLVATLHPHRPSSPAHPWWPLRGTFPSTSQSGPDYRPYERSYHLMRALPRARPPLPHPATPIGCACRRRGSLRAHSHSICWHFVASPAIGEFWRPKNIHVAHLRY